MLNWYLQSGNDSDVVLSTRIRSSRKLKTLKEIEQSGNQIINAM